MSMLDSVLREKRLRRTQRLHECAAAWARCEASELALSTARRLHEEARALLLQTMTAAELCVQRLSIAKLQESAMQRSAEEADRTHTANLEQLEALRQQLARIEKDIEKLEERWQLRCDAQTSERLKGEWRELDDWILGRGTGEAKWKRRQRLA